MLPQKNRITTEEFKPVMDGGKRVFTPHISLTYLKNNIHFKGSVVVSKKISKKAAERNQQKRVVREAVKKIFMGKSSFPYSCLFFVNKSVEAVAFTDLLDEMTALSKKIN